MRNPATVDAVQRFRAHMVGSGLVRPGWRVVVALSGGLDSVALLYLLRFGLWDMAIDCIAAHFDHRMRQCSGQDARWVAGLCKAWEVPLVLGRATHQLSSEAQARNARYRFLRKVLDRREAHVIATGHHADDQAETVLFRIIRGTGLHGLRGIPRRSGAVVRPILGFRRWELEELAAHEGIGFRLDPTNYSTVYARNRLRHEVLPLLESISPGTVSALVRLSAHADSAEQAWAELLERELPKLILHEGVDRVELAREQLLSYHPHFRVGMLRDVLRRFGSRPDRAGTRAALEFTNSGTSGSEIQVAGGLVLEREFDKLIIRQPHTRESLLDRPLSIPEPGTGTGDVWISGRQFVVEWRELPDRSPEPGRLEPYTASLEVSALRFPLRLRGWRPGDRIRLSCGTKKLKKLFVEHRVGRGDRASTPVLVDAGGEVIWVGGIACSELVQPRGGGRVLELRARHA